MKCPYCGKQTYDMPDHLMENKKCGNKHYENLRIDWEKVCSKHKQKDKKIDGGKINE